MSISAEAVLRSCGPDPDAIYPDQLCEQPVYLGQEGRICFLKNAIDNPLIEIGEYTYAASDDFLKKILFHWDENKLVIGKFCSIALNVEICMGGSHNHNPSWFSTYPFASFGDGWEDSPSHVVPRGDTVIGHDVWIGYGAHIMPGVTIGNGAIIATRALVTKDVEPYTIVGGNPAKPIRKRFDEETIEILQRVCWWDWSIEKITRCRHVICSGDVEALLHASESA